MENNLNYSIHPKEKLYFGIKVIAGLLGYMLIFLCIEMLITGPNAMAWLPLLFYIPFIFLYIFLNLAFLIGHLKGNAIKITKKQFPAIYDIIVKQCRRLEMTVPEVYILESGGLLNAFATRFIGSGYVVIYSDIFEEALDGNKEVVEFVIGHELGHLKRGHITKRLLLFPSFIVPFLNRAYSRACEYTCDNIGAALSPEGAPHGILMLASGKKLLRKVNAAAFVEQSETEYSFWYWFSEKMSRHPHLVKRLKQFKVSDKIQRQPIMQTSNTVHTAPEVVEKETSDHSSYLPKN